jgi:ADP-glucose pyrophosphorylase
VGLDQSSEDWQRRFAIIEPGATVHPTALVHDSVVLSGAQVGSRAAIIRSILGPKAVIASGQVVRDSVIA